jgi:hypothetical protein
MEPLAEYVDGLPNLCLQEPLISEAITAGREYAVFPHDADTERAASAFRSRCTCTSQSRSAATCAPRRSSATWRG